MWTLQGRRADIYASISAHKDERAVCIKTKPGRHLLLLLLEHTQAREIYISPGLWKTVPKKVRAALENVGVKVVVAGKNAGRPAKYRNEVREQALELARQKKTARAISQQLSIPITAIYWWKLVAGLSEKRRKKNRARIRL
jgi:hypothetical protein